MGKTKWQVFIEAILETAEDEIACEDCFELLDSYVDLLLENPIAADIMPAVEHHMKQCNCCAAELEAMLIMLDKALPQEEGKK